MMPGPGFLLAALDPETDPGLWFIIYADDEGIVAFDLTAQHPHIFYRGFEAVLNFEDLKPATEKVVLLGGKERSDDALIILHEAAASTADSNPINEEFAFLSYNYVLLPGRPPAITTPDNRPSEIKLKKASRFLIAMGYRIFDSGKMQEQLKSGQWICLPASTDIVFDTDRHERRAKFLRQMN